MRYIKKIRIIRKGLNMLSVEVYAENLKKEHRIIVKLNVNQYQQAYSLGTPNQYVADFMYAPVSGQNTPVRIYVYNYLTDKTEEIRHESVEDLYLLGISQTGVDGSFPSIDSSQFIELVDLLPGSDSINRGWCSGLFVNKIEGPFQNGKIVDEIDFQQKVAFHAFTGFSDLNEIELLSVKWELTTPDKKTFDPRSFKDTTITARKNYALIEFYLPQTISFVLSAYYFFNKEAKITYNHPVASVPKTKIHFTIGMFFDGTGNNRFNSEKVYYEHLKKEGVKDKKRGNLVYTHIPENMDVEGVTVDNTSSYWNPYSNVALLYDLYKSGELYTDEIDGKQKITLKQYVQGIGTLEKLEDDVWGSGFGEGSNGIIGKVVEGCIGLTDQISKLLTDETEIGSITFDVFGFSRGAAAARHFCNEILGAGSVETIIYSTDFKNSEKEYPVKVKDALYVPVDAPKTFSFPISSYDQEKDKRITISYNLGILGKILKTQKESHIPVYEHHDRVKGKDILEQIRQEQENGIVKIRFLGLFDTVVSQMVVKNNFGNKLDLLSRLIPPLNFVIPSGLGTLTQMTLNKVKQKIDHLPIQQVVHLIAEDEWRENFALTRAGTGKNIFEITLPGSHSDIGGGYAARKTDTDILEYEYVTTYNVAEIPKSERLNKLKNFYISNGYIEGSQDNKIEIRSTFIAKHPEPHTGLIKSTYLLQLIATRNITPRYSVINMNVMKELAILRLVPFNSEKLNYEYSFEFDVPKSLKDYSDELVKNIKLKFEGKKEKLMENQLEKSQFIHLSATYNASIGIERFGESVIGKKAIDKIFYVNAPRYADKNQDNYQREDYTHPQ